MSNSRKLQGVARTRLRATRHEKMAAFDALPRALRDVLNDAVGRYNPVEIARELARGVSVDDMIRRIARRDTFIAGAAMRDIEARG